MLYSLSCRLVILLTQLHPRDDVKQGKTHKAPKDLLQRRDKAVHPRILLALIPQRPAELQQRHAKWQDGQEQQALTTAGDPDSHGHKMSRNGPYFTVSIQNYTVFQLECQSCARGLV